jgi:regulatory protein YycI of two-component signal transduction system YycFG
MGHNTFVCGVGERLKMIFWVTLMFLDVFAVLLTVEIAWIGHECKSINAEFKRREIAAQLRESEAEGHTLYNTIRSKGNDNR